MGTPQSTFEPSQNAVSPCQWHEARLRDLEIAYKGITSDLIPVVVRLETKLDSVVEKVGDLSETVKEFRGDLGKVQKNHLVT
jgi:archaellum component FlaC